jgi:hypothetical protein
MSTKKKYVYYAKYGFDRYMKIITDLNIPPRFPCGLLISTHGPNSYKDTKP